MRKLYATILAAGLVMLLALPAFASVGNITVDGVEYPPVAPFNSEVAHYFTPGASSVGSAFTARHTWNGVHGIDNVPCDGTFHWIDNNNLLTISHCVSGSTTTTVPDTTTTVPDTTTTVPDTTTSTTVPDTTTTVPDTTTTTTVPDTTTTTVPDVTTTTTPDTTTTTVPTVTTTVPTTLPRTGAANMLPWGIGGLILLALGGATLWLTKEN